MVIATGGNYTCCRKACNCPQLIGWTPRLHFLFSSSPHFPPWVPGSVLFDQDQLQHAYSSFYHLSLSKCFGMGASIPKHFDRAIGGSKSHRDDCCMMQCQIMGIRGGRIGYSLNSGSQKDPCNKVRLLQSRIVHSRNVHMEPCIPPLLAAWITQPLLLWSPYFLLCILKSGTVTCLIRYIVPTKWR